MEYPAFLHPNKKIYVFKQIVMYKFGRQIKLLPKLPIPVSSECKMENEYRVKQKKSYNMMRMSYDLTIAILLLGMSVVMLFAEKLKIEQLSGPDNSFFRYFFGGLCLLYGGFRLYRGVKHDY